MSSISRYYITASILMVSVLGHSTAQAGVFNIPRFVEPGKWALGFEPELTLTDGAGLAANLKFAYGLGTLTNATAIIGTGSGPLKFRAGGNLVFDFIPDIEKQPGIGIATQAVYYRMDENRGALVATAIPYIHKAFSLGDGNEVEPFVAMPFGGTFSDGNYQGQVTFALGSMFKQVEKIRYVLELGIDVDNAYTYISGGFIYYY